jgi:hypothetical protein
MAYEDFFAAKAEMAELKIKLCNIGLSILDEPTPRKSIAMEMEKVIKSFEKIEFHMIKKES